MSSLKSLTEQILRILSSGNISDDINWDEREIAKAIGQSRDRRMRLFILETSKMDGEIAVTPDMLSVYKNVTVSKDSDLNQYYSELPVGILAGLPYDMGIYHISLMQDQQNSFKRVPNGGVSLYHGLEASNLEGNTGFYYESGRVYYTNYLEEWYPGRVLMKLVAKTDDIDLDAEIPMPAEMELDVVNEVISLYGASQQQRKDTTNDSEDNR